MDYNDLLACHHYGAFLLKIVARIFFIGHVVCSGLLTMLAMWRIEFDSRRHATSLRLTVPDSSPVRQIIMQLRLVVEGKLLFE